MAERVIELLEIVHVDKNRRHQAAIPTGAGQHLVELAFNGGAVDQAGQRIVVRQLENLVGCALAFRRVAEDGDMVGDRARGVADNRDAD